MASDSTVKISFIGDAKDLQKALDGLDKDLFKVSETAKKSGGGFADFAKKAGVGLGAVAVGATALGVKIFELGSQLEIMKKKAATVFEDSLPQVQKWATETATRMGLTKTEAVGLAASFADLLKPMGFTAEQAADMSTKVVGLSGALAAWSGGTKTAAEVSAVLAKAMLGERDGLKELGISITEADISARLLRDGNDKLTGSALEQAKALATQQLIFEKSADAQKAWNEHQFTGAEVANQLKVKLKDLQEQIAEKLYPILLQVGTWLVEVGVPKLEEMGKKVGEWWEKQDGLREALKKAVEIFEALIRDVEAFIVVVQTAVEWTDKLAQKLNSIPDKIFGLPTGLGGKGSPEEMVKQLRGMGMSDKDIKSILRDQVGPIGSFASGGVVPGPAGAAQLAVVHGGERILTRAQQQGGGIVVNVTVQGNVWGTDLERIVARAVVDASNNSGGLPIRIRAAS